MEISTKVRLIIIVILSAIIGVILFFFVKRNNPLNKNLLSTSQQITSNISKGGVFFVGPKTPQGQNLIYRDLSQKYYNAGYCTDCPTACSTAQVIQDIIKAQCTTSNQCVPVLVSSALDITKSYLQKAGTNVMTQVDCSVVIDTSGNPASSYINQQAMSMISQSGNNAWTSLWDFITTNKAKIIPMVEQFGAQLVLQNLIGEYTIVFMVLPGLLGSDANARYASGVQLGVFGGKDLIFQALPKALNALARSQAESLIAKSSDTLLEAGNKLGAALVDKVAEEMAARMAASVLEAMAEAIDPITSIIGMVGMIGMVLDVIDPCGLGDTLSKDDIDATQQAYDSAIFSAMLKNVGRFPVEWYAEAIQQYGLVCPSSSSSVGGKINKTGLDHLTRPENIFGGTGDDCEDQYTQKSLAYTGQYQDSLTVNSLGQCVKKMTNDELNARCSDLLGIPITFPTGDAMFSGGGIFKQFQKSIDYVSMILADQNVIVAQFLSTWWYIVVVVLMIILLISFFL